VARDRKSELDLQIEEGLTYKEIALRLSISEQRVREIEKIALQKIARSKKGKLLFDTWTFLLQQKRG